MQSLVTLRLRNGIPVGLLIDGVEIPSVKKYRVVGKVGKTTRVIVHILVDSVETLQVADREDVG